MNRSARKNSTGAVALTNPRPRRVSLCKAGANQSPLNRCKSDVAVEKKELPAMLTAMKAQGYDIASIAFEGDQWNRDAATAWLAEGGYTDYALKGDAGSITAEAKDAELPENAELRSVKTDGGVTVTLFKEVSDSEGIEETSDKDATVDAGDGAASAVQPVAKACAAIIERAKSVQLDEDRVKSLYTVSEFASLIRDLRWLVFDVTYEHFYDADDGALSDPTRQQLVEEMKAIGLQLLQIFATLVNLEVEDMSEAFKSAQEDTMTDKTKTEAEAPAEKTEDNKAADTAAPEATKTEEGVEAAPADPAAASANKEDADEAAAAPEGEAAAEDASKDDAEGANANADKADADAGSDKSDEQAPAWAAGLVATVGKLTERMDAIEAKNAPEGDDDAEKSSEPEASTDVPARKSADADEAGDGNSAEKQVQSEKAVEFERRRMASAIGLG